MEHPGVQMLINRIFKPSTNQKATDSCSSVTTTSTTTVNRNKATTSTTTTTTTTLEIENRCIKTTKSEMTTTQTSNRFTDFKQQLLSRMKAKRSQMRKEELEEEKIDEEYCEEKARRDDDDDSNSKKSGREENETNEDEQDVQEVEDDADEESSNMESDDDDDSFTNKEKKRRKKKLMESDEEDAVELNSSCGSNDSDKDFKLNLNDEEDNDDDELAQIGGEDDNDEHNVNRKEKKSASNKSKHKNKMKRAPSSNEITQTNSIPSNQLTKNSQAFNKNFELFMSQESSLLSSNQKRRESLEELNNVSFSIKFDETAGTQNHNNNNMSNTNEPDEEENTSKGVEEAEEDELGVFDELAMLCSGQFRKEARKVNLKEINDCYNFMDSIETTETIEKHVVVETTTNTQNMKEISLTNNELYAVDDDDEEEEVGNEKKKVKKLGTIVALEDEEESRESGDTEENGASSSPRSKEDPEEDKDDDENEEEAEENSKKKKMRREDFFENEAELSGSEMGSDEDEDGEDSANSIVFSGDEDQFNDAELKDELAKIYLKDKLDQDKRELRMFKEKYLLDDETRNKDFRRKKFLWKNANDEWNNNDNNSSSDEEEDEDEEEEGENGEKKEFDIKLDAKKFKFAKNGNWRSVRHERELFVRSKSKQDNEELLSDDNDEENTMNSMSSQSQMSNNGLLGADFGAFGSLGGNQLLKKGQELLKTTQIKRTFEGSFTNKTKFDDDLQPLAQIGSENNSLPLKTSDSFVKKSMTNEASPSTLLQKFSFLNRDKTYINRVSNYINKNMVNNELMSGSAKGTTRSSNMVFLSLDLNNENSSTSNNTNEANSENKKKVEKSNSIENDLTASYKSEPKRVKYDTCGSIFNHIN